jgi:hypothetical protein
MSEKASANLAWSNTVAHSAAETRRDACVVRLVTVRVPGQAMDRRGDEQGQVASGPVPL